MLGAVLAWSLIPLLFASSGGTQSPFLFNAAWNTGVVVSTPPACWMLFRRAFMEPAFWRAVARNLRSWTLPPAIANSAQFALFSWSTRYVDIAIASVLLEMWPLSLIILMDRLMAREGRYRRNMRRTLPLMAAAFAGTAMVVASQAGGFSTAGAAPAGLAAGTALALTAGLLGGADAFTFRWGRDLAEQLRDMVKQDRDDLILMGSMLAYAITNTVGIVASLVIGVASGETLSPEVAAIGAAGGLTLHAGGNLMFRKANMATSNLGVNALGYLAPLTSIGALALLWRVNVAEPSWLVAGAAVVVVANGMIGLEGRGKGRGGQQG